MRAGSGLRVRVRECSVGCCQRGQASGVVRGARSYASVTAKWNWRGLCCSTRMGLPHGCAPCRADGSRDRAATTAHTACGAAPRSRRRCLAGKAGTTLAALGAMPPLPGLLACTRRTPS